MAGIAGSKQDLLIELLERPGGVTLAEAIKMTGWQVHSVRGAISGIVKRKPGFEIKKGKDISGVCVYRLMQRERSLVVLGSALTIARNETHEFVRQDAGLVPYQRAEQAPPRYYLPTITDTEEAKVYYTVADAIRDYMVHYSKEGKGVSVTRNIIEASILPKLGRILLADLKTKTITEWHYGLSRSPAKLRTKAGAAEYNVKPLGDDPEAIRRRKSTANRILTVLKAALNFAWREGVIDTDLAWRRVRAFRNVEAPVIRYLNEEECLRLVRACDENLRLIVQAGLFTGCRYGEICRLVAADYRADTGTIYVRISKSGKPRHVVLTEEGKKFFQNVVRDKPPTDHLFKSKDGQLLGKSWQSRRILEACAQAAIDPPITFHVLRHTYGSLLAMKGVPMAVVAKQLGHATTQITEKHYAHIGPNYVAQTVRENFPDLGIGGL